MRDFQRLMQFHHRQVILNYYAEDELVSKEGFQFDIIRLEARKLKIMKDHQLLATIDLDLYSVISPSTTFANCYLLEHGSSFIEVYFP